MVSTIEELDEMRARSMCARIGYSEERAGLIWSSFLPDVIAIRDADEHAGLVTVPREITEDMAYAYETHGHRISLGLFAYDAMIAASPFAKKDNAK